MDALEKLGLKRRVVAHEFEGYGKVHFRDLSIAEWRGCLDGEADQSAKLLTLALCDESGKALFAEGELSLDTLPPPLVHAMVDKVAKLSRFSEDAAKN